MRRVTLSAAAFAIGGPLLLWSARGQDAPPSAAAVAPGGGITATGYRGAGACSAVACHGSIAPLAGSSVLRNEHTTWICDDKHSRAFELLFDRRSIQIERNLAAGTDKDPLLAQLDARCLACHTTPRPDNMLARTAWLNGDGVGCESCHGSAAKWLGMHTTDDWRSIPARDKDDRYGFTYTKSLLRRIELCSGCHVGRDARDGLSPRDINHDLIAAGHPRLAFEFAAYQENQPKHWKTDTPGAVEAAADFPARAWALGQLVTAKAALELLRTRSAAVAASAPGNLPEALPASSPSRPPWPEFAEYNCFSCHHSLADEEWRRNRQAAGPAVGTPEWGSWYYPMTATLLDQTALGMPGKHNAFAVALQSMLQEMNRPNPDAGAVQRTADACSRALDGPIAFLWPDGGPNRPLLASQISGLIESLSRPDEWGKVTSWDHASQRYLALVPLNQAWRLLDRVPVNKQQALLDDLHDLLCKLRFPEGYDSPRGFDPAWFPAGRRQGTRK
jgi:Cytochrome c554 and c-prime